jgi:hypothetical protein
MLSRRVWVRDPATNVVNKGLGASKLSTKLSRGNTSYFTVKFQTPFIQVFRNHFSYI